MCAAILYSSPPVIKANLLEILNPMKSRRRRGGCVFEKRKIIEEREKDHESLFIFHFHPEHFYLHYACCQWAFYPAKWVMPAAPFLVRTKYLNDWHAITTFFEYKIKLLLFPLTKDMIIAVKSVH